MTNTVPAVFNPAAATMSSRSSLVPPNSYASVLAGQTRLSHLNTNLPGSSITAHNHPSPYLRTPGNFGNALHPATVPSYLSESLYAERLASRTSSVFSPLSPTTPTSPGKTPRNHRGLAFDVIEHAPPEESALNPLPSRWNAKDRCESLEIAENGSEARFTAPAVTGEMDAASVRADKPMPPQCGLFYFEVTIVAKPKGGEIGIGFCTEKVSLGKLPGFEHESWGYHGDDGHSFCGTAKHKKYGPKFTANDVVGCGVNFRTKSAFFTKNGIDLGIAFREINAAKLFPVVGMRKAGEHVRVNFGQEGFIFDIDHYMKMEKARTYEDINLHSTASLCLPLDETALVQALVGQYLTHDGYVDTARAFAEEVQREAKALDNGWQGVLPLDPKSDADAVNRQRIRCAILEGDVDRALKLTNTFYPEVLQENKMLNFRLRRRKLVEMIRENSEPSREKAPVKNGFHSKPSNYASDMDIDDTSISDWEKMEVEDESHAHVEHMPSLDAAVEYAQKLRVEFDSDTRPDVKKLLQEAVGLVAYQDPRSSVLSHLLDEDERAADAEELNSAILVSLGKSSVSALERMVKQTAVLIQDISEDGGPGAFVNLRNDYLKDSAVI